MFKTSAAVLLVAIVLGASSPAAAQGTRTYQMQTVVMNVDGKPLEPALRFRGGAIFADVIVEPGTSGIFPTKRPGSAQAEPIVVDIPVGSASAQQLIRSAWQGNFVHQQLVVTMGDLSGNIISQLQAKQALLTAVSLPALDASSKEGGYFTLEFATDSLQRTRPGGKLQPTGGVKQSPWLVNSFRLAIDGIDCTRVSRIEPLAAKLKMPQDAPGDVRVLHKSPLTWETPTLRITFAASHSHTWEQWFEQFIINGKNSQSEEKNGSLSLLAPDGKTELAVINFYNMGIVRLAEVQAEAGGTAVLRMIADVYCERVELAAPGGAVATAAPSAPAAADSVAPASEQAPVEAPVEQKPSDSEIAERAAELYRLQPNPRLPSEMGRLVLRLPEQTTNRHAQRLEIRKTRDDGSPSVLTGNIAQELPPGEYFITLNGRRMQVQVEAGADTLLLVGLVRVKEQENVSWSVLEEDFDNSRPIAQSIGGQELALPPGEYFVRIQRETRPVTVKAGELTEVSLR